MTKKTASTMKKRDIETSQYKHFPIRQSRIQKHIK